MVPAAFGARYPIAYSHYNVPQTSNPQRRQIPEEASRHSIYMRSGDYQIVDTDPAKTASQAD